MKKKQPKTVLLSYLYDKTTSLATTKSARLLENSTSTAEISKRLADFHLMPSHNLNFMTSYRERTHHH